MLADVLHFGGMSDAPNRIRELRLEAGLSQQALGDAAGTSKMTVSDLERGSMALTQDYMRRIAEVLGVLPGDLLPFRENPAALTVAERRLIAQLRAASDEQRDQVHKVAEVIAPFKAAELPSERLTPRKSLG